MIKGTPDKINGVCEYYDKEHVYIDRETNTKFISVTTLIHNYVNEFDPIFWSSYKAIEAIVDAATFEPIKRILLGTKRFNDKILKTYGIDVEEFARKQSEILKGYEDEKNKSCERGTKIHAEFENSFYGNSTFDFNKRFKIPVSGTDFICKENFYDLLSVEKGVFPEFLIYKTSSDGILKVAGQIDLLIKDGWDIYIIDHKTNKEIKTKSFFDRIKKKSVSMKFPLSNLDDCNYWHYTLQLSLYAYLIQQIDSRFVIKGLTLNHIDHAGKQTLYELEYLKDDVERMLKHYKKQIKIQEELNKDKPICLIC